MSLPSPPLLWYGDDFTGASDTLSVLAQAQRRAVLFLDVPTERQRQQASQALGGELDAIGIAGHARSLAPDVMARELAPVGRFFEASGCQVLHYKVCSTFDSAPHIGSIGRAFEVLRPFAPNPFVPIIGGQPSLGRYCAFSNLFAAAGAGGPIARIDRHPTMSQHPVTPMGEADLIRHLALQGLAPLASWHLPRYELDADQQDRHLRDLLGQQPAGVLMDATHADHLAQAGRLLWQAAKVSPMLAIGASSVAQALVSAWPRSTADLHASPTGLMPTAMQAPLAAARGPVFIFAGSLSPVTAAQVAGANRFDRIPLDPAVLLDEGDAYEASLGQVLQSLARGRHTLAVTAPEAGKKPDTSVSAPLAHATQRWIVRLIERMIASGLKPSRLGIVGGDTSSLAVRALPIWGLSYAGTLGAGVPICRVHSDQRGLDGLELMLKGGQMGDPGVLDRLIGPG